MKTPDLQRAILMLEDGETFWGETIGQPKPVVGEVVFNTSLTGYQEILTDPSYAEQLVTLTTPHIGNTGVNALDQESSRPYARALLVRELGLEPSSWRATESLPDWLRRHELFCMTGLDTRALTRHLRTRGTMRGVLGVDTGDTSRAQLKTLLNQAPPLLGNNLVDQVTCPQPYHWTEGTPSPWKLDRQNEGLPPATDIPESGTALHVVAIDCGIKHTILRQLVDHGFRVTVVPAQTSAAAILEHKPAGVFVSNGPGDPAAVGYVIETIRALLGRIPLFGICLGHQLLALALGARTYKLKFGHRGGNHPVKDLRTQKVAITAHNHGFAVEAESLPASARVTHIDLNDGTCEGIEVPHLRAFSIQFHPEAGPGPHDALAHFSHFRRLILTPEG